MLKINAGNLLIIGATLFWGLDNNISGILTHRIDITKIIQLKSFIGGKRIGAAIVLLSVLIYQIMVYYNCMTGNKQPKAIKHMQGANQNRKLI